MGRKRRSEGEKPRKKKPVTVKLLSRQHAGRLTMPYALMERLVDKHHDHLVDAKIAIAWRFGWKADVDGRIKMVSVKKGSDLDRELHDYDFVILLNHEAWNGGTGYDGPVLNEGQMTIYMDHALCWCQVAKDGKGEPRIDENNRIVYRLRRPDRVEFSEIVARYNCYTSDLDEVAAAGIDAAQRPLLKDKEKPDKTEDHPDTLPIGAPASAAAHTTKPAANGANGEPPAKKRGRPSKAEKAAREAAQRETSQEPAAATA